MCPFIFAELYKHFIRNQVFSIYRHLKLITLHRKVFLISQCMCVSYLNPFVSVLLQFVSLYVMMQLFRINSALESLELLSFKGIFMRRKKSLSLIWFKYCQPQQKLHSQKLIKNAESFLVGGEKLSWQDAVLLQHRRLTNLYYLVLIASFSLSFLQDACFSTALSAAFISQNVLLIWILEVETKK